MQRPPDDTIEQILFSAEQLKLNGNHEEALIVLERLLTIDPDNVTAFEELADNELSLGQYTRAEQAARRALELQPKSFTAHYILGFIASHFERWSESVSALQIANRLDQNNPEILRCLGWSLFADHKTVEGMVTLERALNLEEGNPLILCDLGVVYLKMKHYAKSQTLLRRAIDLDPENMRAKECLDMVQRIERHTQTTMTEASGR